MVPRVTVSRAETFHTSSSLSTVGLVQDTANYQVGASLILVSQPVSNVSQHYLAGPQGPSCTLGKYLGEQGQS